MKRKIHWVPVGIMLLAAVFVDLSRDSLPEWLVIGFTIGWVLIVAVCVYQMVSIKR
ncbi:hypothetical protein [Levilactobacillus cerevisiae]|uniref:hypothetical protein n=1 Tax=Levilactobacillus cerevisiae TaxID=1704076 RepID=UPI0013DE4CB7|nr:hypothetical protein [Levilactobacillus cerevisiae]